MSWMGFLGRRGDVDGRRGWQEGVLDRGGERGARVLNFVLFFFFFLVSGFFGSAVLHGWSWVVGVYGSGVWEREGGSWYG